MNLRRLAALVSYHGGSLHGFQRQPGFPTVQEELERAWMATAGESIVMHGSGRTDSGVHAWGQVVHWSTQAKLPVERAAFALNADLPEEIAVRQVAEVDESFHARTSATGKRYLYLLAHGATRPVLRPGEVAWSRRSLQLDAMRAGAEPLLGRHDFSAFAAAGRTTKTSVRDLRRIRIWTVRGGFAFLFEADGFLYRMVRNLVGSLIEVGRGHRAPEWLEVVLDSRDRRRAGPTAPPEGLYLWRVLYSENPFRSENPLEPPASGVERL